MYIYSYSSFFEWYTNHAQSIISPLTAINCLTALDSSYNLRCVDKWEKNDCHQWSRLSRGCTVDHKGWHTYNILIRIIHTHICNISIKLGVGSYVEASRVLIRIVLAPALGARVARLIRALLHLGFIFRDSDGNIVDRYLVRLRGATVDIFQTRRMPVFAPQFVQFAFLLLDTAGRTTATPFFLARFQKWYILLLRNLYDIR